jgi:hypothetical protein
MEQPLQRYVRLEVGTAHRCAVDETIQLNNQSLII